MVSEIMLLVLLMIINSQSSSLWTSLSIIPTSILLIMTCNSVNVFSGLVMIIYMMIFIGGLMVLLVSVASISYSDQSFYFMKIWVGILVFAVIPLFLFKQISPINYSNQLVMWYQISSFFMLVAIFFLLMALIVLTKLILSFKGMVRSL